MKEAGRSSGQRLWMLSGKRSTRSGPRGQARSFPSGSERGLARRLEMLLHLRERRRVVRKQLPKRRRRRKRRRSKSNPRHDVMWQYHYHNHYHNLRQTECNFVHFYTSLRETKYIMTDNILLLRRSYNISD